jgi:UDP-N-acetylglucosamine 2-epimerase (non-hydrolysing)
MKDEFKVLVVAGARPNFMKVAPLIHAIQRHNERLAASARQHPVSNIQHPASASQPSNVGCSMLDVGGPPTAPSSVQSQLSAFAIFPFAQSPICQLPSPIWYKLVHTGQHYDEKMSEVFFRELGIPTPDINLEVGSGSHAVQTANIMTRFEPVLLGAFAAPPLDSDLQSPISNLPSSTLSASASSSNSNLPSSGGRSPSANSPLRFDRGEGREVSRPSSISHLPSSTPTASALPDWLIVVGDVNSTMACTLVASKLGVKVAHVEAGLRSFDRTMPEEINRLVTDALADLLLTPSSDADENLHREGVPNHKIRLVGNIMIDSLVSNLEMARQSNILHRLGVKEKDFAFVTLHRPSNVDDQASLTAIMEQLRVLSARLPVVFPIHPRTRRKLATFGIQEDNNSRFQFIDPVGYHDSLCLAERARLVLTDSGGLQEETTFFGTSCLTLRPNTERPVTVTLGSNRLTNLSRLDLDLHEVLSGDIRKGQLPPLWDGHTGERCLQALLEKALD